MAKTINSIEAAKMEAAGEGSFEITGRKIIFRAGRIEFTWNCKTEAEARSHLAMFRASLKYAA